MPSFEEGKLKFIKLQVDRGYTVEEATQKFDKIHSQHEAQSKVASGQVNPDPKTQQTQEPQKQSYVSSLLSGAGNSVKDF
jgi:hypothetical protein